MPTVGGDAPLWRRWWRLWWGTVVAPARTLKEIAAGPSLGSATVAAILFPLLYSACALWLGLSGRPHSWEPWVSVIPSETYYLWEAGFLVPLSLLLWVLFGALGHLFARLQGGGGSFEATLAVFAFTLAVPQTVLFWLPDALQYLAGALWGWPFATRFVAVYSPLATLWTLLLSALGLRLVQSLTWPKALLAAILALTLGYGPGVALLIR